MADLHVHAAPSLLPRHGDDAPDRRRASAQPGSAPSCSSRTRAAPSSAPPLAGAGVYGGIVLNSPVGGANPDAVEVAARLGGRVVWMPTVSAPQPQGGRERRPSCRCTAASNCARSTIVDEAGAPAARAGTRCSTSSPPTTCCWRAGTSPRPRPSLLFTEARRRGVQRLLVNHPLMAFLHWTDAIGPALLDEATRN